MATARKTSNVLTATALAVATLATLASASTARADGDDDVGGDPGGDTAAPVKPEFGVALRVRNVRVPESLIELFVEDAPKGVSQAGFGLVEHQWRAGLTGKPTVSIDSAKDFLELTRIKLAK